jgi:preprotein translocase subunit SecD
MKTRSLATSFAVLLVLAFGGLLATLLTDNTPALGLDLQGGISVTQEPSGDFSAEGLDLAVERIRERVDALGVSEPEILRQGNAVVVNLPGVDDQQRALDLVQVTGNVYLRPVLDCNQPTLNPRATTTTSDPNATTTTAVTTSTSEPASTDSAAPDSAVDDSTPATDATTTTTTEPPPPTILPPPTTLVGDVTPSDPMQQAQLILRADESEIITQVCNVGPTLLGPDGTPITTGAVFERDNSVQFANSGGGGWTVSVNLRGGEDGEDPWNQLAALCFNRSSQCPSGQIAIELDGEVISAPTVNQANFSGGVDITVGGNKKLAEQLSEVLASGALPVDLKTVAVQNISPSLGEDSLRAALLAGFVGVLLVLAFMTFYYGRLGLVVAFGLLVSGALLWTVISILSSTVGLALSLSGVAGIIVSVGVTVDSYVVFFERLKDELKAGRTLRNSALRGFKASWRTILIADLVSFLGALVLWSLTVGSVRNFAFFLGLSTLTDLVVSYFYTRPAVLLLARTKALSGRVMGVEVAEHAQPAGATA